MIWNLHQLEIIEVSSFNCRRCCDKVFRTNFF